MKKALIIVENCPAPLDWRVRCESTALRDNGYEVTVLSPRTANYNKRHEVVDGIHVYRHPLARLKGGVFAYVVEYTCALLWQFIYVWWIYFARGFDVIQGCNPPDDIFIVAQPFRLLGIPYIFDHHDVCPELYLSKYDKKNFAYKAQVLLERWSFRFSDVIMSTNESYRDIATGRGGVDPDDVFVVRNGPNLKRLKAVTPRPALRRGKRFLVGYVGAIDVQEGLDILLNVALRLRQLGRDDIHFTCVGDGPALPRLREIALRDGLEDTVTFTGTISDAELMEVLSTADVCVNPDKPCPMNNLSTMIKIMEYMALAKPIVQFEVKEGRVSAGSASLYADPANAVEDFAAKIIWLLDRPEERARMGRIGRERVENGLEWSYSIRHLLAAYDRAFVKRGHSKTVERTAPMCADTSAVDPPEAPKDPEADVHAYSRQR